MTELEFNQIVYFIMDEENEPFIITGIVDRGEYTSYLVGNKNGEKEVTKFEISSNKIVW